MYTGEIYNRYVLPCTIEIFNTSQTEDSLFEQCPFAGADRVFDTLRGNSINFLLINQSTHCPDKADIGQRHDKTWRTLSGTQVAHALATRTNTPYTNKLLPAQRSLRRHPAVCLSRIFRACNGNRPAKVCRVRLRVSVRNGRQLSSRC